MPLLMKVPLILWGNKAPSHRIKCISVCQSGIIVTGSIEGQLLLWSIYKDVKNEYKIIPENIILAHSCSIESIVTIYNEKLGINSGIISLSENQEICLWNSDTGCCLYKIFLQGRYHTLQILYKKNGNKNMLRETLIACYGAQNSILIIDPFTLKILVILKQSLNSNVLNTIKMCCFVPSPCSSPCSCSSSSSSNNSNNGNNNEDSIDDKLIAITYNGILLQWNIGNKLTNDGNSNTISSIYGKEESIRLVDYKNINFISISPSTLRYLILSSKRIIYLYLYEKFQLLNECEVDNVIAGIEFISSYHLLVYFLNSNPIIYQINENDNKLDKKLILISNKLNYTNLATSFQYTSTCKSGAKNDADDKLDCCFIIGKNNKNDLNIWIIGKYNETKNDIILFDDNKTTILINSTNSLIETWNNTNLLSVPDSSNFQSVNIYCSLHLHEFGFMILGLYNGNIIVKSTIEIVMQKLLDNHKNDNVPYLTLIGHHGPVSCLCYPYEECNKHDPCHLLSGGSDFSIRLWNIVTKVQLKCFYPHGGYIQDIFVATGEFIGAANLAIISISSDYSVALINLSLDRELLITRSHTSPVYSVKWKAKEDLLFVLCSDGTLFIWDIITANLERCITGKIAIDIFTMYSDEDVAINQYNNGERDPCDSNNSNSTPPTIILLETNDENELSPQNNNILNFKDLRHKKKLNRNATTFMIDVGTSRITTKQKMKKAFSKIASRSHSSKSKIEREQKSTSLMATTGAAGGSITISSSTTNNHPSSSLTNSISHHSSAHNLAQISQPIMSNMNSSTMNVMNSIDESNNLCTATSMPPFDVLSVRTGNFDPEFHILLIDSDMLINQLLSDDEKDIFKLNAQNQQPLDTRYSIIKSMNSSQQVILNNYSSSSSPNSSQSLSLLVLTLGLCPTSDSKTYHKYCKSLQLYHSIVLESTALLLISCLHPWGIDVDLDSICCNRLNLSKPTQSISFGFISHNKFQLSLPKPLSSSLSLAKQHEEEIEKYMYHWQVSTVMTTQHIVIIVALTDAFLQLNSTDKDTDNVRNIHSSDKLSIRIASSQRGRSESRFTSETCSISVPDLSRRLSSNIGSTKAYDHTVGWKLLHIQHSSTTTCLMRDHINYQPPLMQELIFYWMDSCEEIRNSSYAILVSELRRMSSLSRQNLIRSWSTYLPESSEAENTPIEDLIVLPLEDYIESGGFYGFWPCDKKSQQTLAIFLIAFVASEFNTEFDPLLSITIKRNNNNTDTNGNVLTTNMLRIIAIIFSKVLNTTINLQKYSFYSIRRSCVFLLGRCFGIWQNYFNLSQLMISLLDTTATLNVYIQHLDIINKTRSQSYTYCNELLLNYRSCLIEIILSYPELFITLLNKEMTRFNSSNMYSSMGQSALVAASVYSNLRRPSNNQTISHPNMLQLSRNEIIILIEILVKRSPDKVYNLLLEMIDLLLHCGSYRINKKDNNNNNNIMKIFPFLTAFNMIDYSETTRKLAVGTSKGQFGIYDIKNLRCQLIITNFTHPITCLKFSPDGRSLVIYCYDELQICIYHLHSSLLGLVNSTPRPGTNFHFKQQKTIQPGQLYKIHFIWESNNSFKLIFDDDYDLMFTM